MGSDGIERGSLSNKELEFERKRLLNLIECRIRRNELDLAQEHAEELFNRELQFEVLREARRFVRYNRIFIRAILFLVGLFCLLAACAVLDIHPSFSVAAVGCIVLSIVSLVFIDTLIAGRFERSVELLMNTYDAEKLSFIRRVFESCRG
ncbi:MAG: hypothetical protein K8I29_00505 [Alphaproteobacteria bacterium]|uniref:Uncharacterized protein n=1 Tax=Candidatus Nitrobium versatile TaxID=2884831 RepID=A0A953J7K9_9BACT|nr:hypothetical protein [Candidatus Nitrobium versatile]